MYVLRHSILYFYFLASNSDTSIADLNFKTDIKNIPGDIINLIIPGSLSKVTDSVTNINILSDEQRELDQDKEVTIAKSSDEVQNEFTIPVSSYEEQKEVTIPVSSYEVQNNLSSKFLLVARDHVFQHSSLHSSLNVSSLHSSLNVSSLHSSLTISSKTGDFQKATDLQTINRTTGQFYISPDDCNNKVFTMISQTEGFIYGTMDKINPFVRSCSWNVIVPEGMFMLVSIEIQEPCAAEEFIIKVSEYESMNLSTIIANQTCEEFQKQVLASISNILYFQLDTLSEGLSFEIQFQVHIQVTTQSHRLSLPAVFDHPYSGHVTSPGYSEDSMYSGYTNASYRLNVPNNNSVMISFQRIDIQDGYECNNNYVSVSAIESSGLILKFKGCNRNTIPTSIYNTSLMIQFVTSSLNLGTGFKMLFSFHLQVHQILKSPEGLFDCTVPYYLRFKHHLTCNLEQECIGGEDERDCPFSSEVCNGSVAFENRCYSFHHSEIFITWIEAQQRCQKRGGNLAMPKTEAEKKAIKKMFHYGKWVGRAYFGLHNVYSSLPMMYKYVMKWVDGSVAYSINISYVSKILTGTEFCAQCFHCSSFTVYVTLCHFKGARDYICETETHSGARTEKSITFRRSMNPIVNKSVNTFGRCPNGHFTHHFLTCSPESSCGETRYLAWCQVSELNRLNPNAKVVGLDEQVLRRSAMFVCVDRKRTIPYTLVCDFHYHCIDRSDEDFCIHDNCPEYTCPNRQCVDYDKECNGIDDCYDESDEKYCIRHYQLKFSSSRRIYPPAIINFDHKGNFYQTAIHHAQPCPTTHFRCHGENSYCLPVYVRCNGVYDCPDYEDEIGCELYTCPGFYRCFSSNICVHMDNVCDGFAHCPQGDDELFCDLKCPYGCQCQGLAFACRQTFSPGSYPELRYLDASGSQLSLNDVSHNLYLVWLSLRACQLKVVTQLDIPNLLTLDLSDNLISFIDMNVFLNLKQLSKIILAGNPLVSITSHPVKRIPHSYLKSVDMSNTLIRVFNSDAFKNYPMISFINVSFSTLKVIDQSGFLHLQRIETFDARGTPLSVFPKIIFHGLSHLEKVYSDNYRLCCDEILPKSFSRDFCFSKPDVYSSCEHLLRSDVYRFLMWVIVVMVIAGNTTCFLFTLSKYIRTEASCTSMLLLNLNLADLMMGVYLSIIVISDLVFRGQYVKNENSWKNSVTCKVAGFLSILSTEVSLFIVFIITLDRFIVLRFPCGSFQFRAWSAALICGLAWLSSALVAAIPFSPLTPHTDVSGLSSICTPTTILWNIFVGEKHSLDLMVVLNLLLLSIIAVLQAFVSMTTKTIYLTTDTSQISIDKNVARHFAGIVLLKVLTCYLTSVLHLITFTGSPIPGEIQAVVGVVIHPLSSVLDPLMYAFSLSREKQRRDLEIHLNNRLKGHKVTKTSLLKGTNLMADFSVNEEGAFSILRENLRNRRLTLSELQSYLKV